MELYEKGDFLSPGKVNKLGYTCQTLAHNLSTIKKCEQVSAISMKLTLSCVVGSKKMRIARLLHTTYLPSKFF